MLYYLKIETIMYICAQTVILLDNHHQPMVNQRTLWNMIGMQMIENHIAMWTKVCNVTLQKDYGMIMIAVS